MVMVLVENQYLNISAIKIVNIVSSMILKN